MLFPIPLIALYIIAIIVVIALVVGYLVYKKVSPYFEPVSYKKPLVSPEKVQMLEYNPIAEFNNEDQSYSAQSYDWQYEMRECGEMMSARKLKNIIFVHGTFAGNDPFDIIHFISNMMSLKDSLKQRLQDGLKKSKDSLFGDLGNFDDEYVEMVQQALNHGIKCHNFTWSSSNHHLARIRGTIKLVEFIFSNIERIKSKTPILFIGHSHAGQLFALLSQFLSNKNLARTILETCGYDDYEIKQFLKLFKLLDSLKLDFVTMGTPSRYSWVESKNIRILNMINHRGEEMVGGQVSGAFMTRDGDYIQQWGIAGSDIRPPGKEDNEINLKLDKYLGIGSDFSAWSENIKYLKRVPDFGQTLLIDYKDNSRFPNAWKTLFGHGIYTRYYTMHFNIYQIVKNLYFK
jgi:hypothetical protein